MELWDVYDINRQPLGHTHRRGVPLPKGEYHQVVHICLFNHAGEMLIQQRQPFKEGWPNLWDVTAAGSVLAGETVQQGAARELLEEIGIKADFTGQLPRLTLPFSQGFDDWFVLEKEVDPATLRLQPEEVQAARWAGEEEIFQMLQDGRFIPYEPSLLQLLFAMRTHVGAHRPA